DRTWFPFHVQASSWHHSDQNDQYYSYVKRKWVAEKVDTAALDLRSVWRSLLPDEGGRIRDERHAVPIEYEYRRERSPSEVQAMVDERVFDIAASKKQLARRMPSPDSNTGSPSGTRESRSGVEGGGARPGGVVRAVRRGTRMSVVTLGKNDSIQAGIDLNVYRQNRFLGKVTVLMAYEDHSVCVATTDELARDIRDGDIVRAIGL
ncbi:MAG: hypothetical protein AAF989_12910, partial [Planctomycetota bacterium]